MENYGICHLSAIAVRAEASHRSEMVNQLLFGETFTVVDSFKSWVVISGSLDNYQGFIDNKQFLPIEQSEHDRLKGLPAVSPTNLVNQVFDKETGLPHLIFSGSNLAGLEGSEFAFGDKKFRFEGETFTPEKIVVAANLVETARMYLNTPYLWGGRTPFGIDCSGLVQVIFKIHGIDLLRDASYQAQSGETLNLFEEAKAGDLAFFDDEEGKIIHVGIIAGDGKIIHASGQVRVDRIDHHGIYNDSLQKYTHKLRLLKRVING